MAVMGMYVMCDARVASCYRNSAAVLRRNEILLQWLFSHSMHP